MENKHWLSSEDFNYIYSKVPRFNIDLVIHKDDGVVLVQRAIEPYLGYWHLPGGTVYKGETIIEAAIRIAKNETGLDVDFVKCIDYVEFLNEIRNSINMHTIGLVMEMTFTGGVLSRDKNAKEIKIVTGLSEVSPVVIEHVNFLQKYKILE